MQLDTILDYTYDVNYSVQKGECLELGMCLPLSYCMEYEDHIGASNTIPFEMESVDIDGEGRIYHTSTSGYKYDCYLKDHLGSTRMVVNDEDVVTEAFAYQPYGTIIPLEDIVATPQTPTRQQFTGKEFDTEGGIDAYYFGARMYDPEIGRWVSVDKEMQFIDAYLYCHTNPIMYVDTNGNFDTFIHFLVGNFGHPLRWASPTFGIVRGVSHALPDLYNHVHTHMPKLAKWLGWKKGSKRQQWGEEAHTFQGNYSKTLDYFKEGRPDGMSRIDWQGHKWHVSQDYWEGKRAMSLTQAGAWIFGEESLKEYQDHLQGITFMSSLIVPIPGISDFLITDYITGVVGLGLHSSYTYASLEYDSRFGEGAFKQNMKEEAVQKGIEMAALPIDPVGTTIARVVTRIFRWFK